MGSSLMVFLYFGSAILPMETKGASRSHPDIWLSEYRVVDSIEINKPDDRFNLKQNFENEFIFKNGRDFIITEDATSIDFSCKAEYPIIWKFPNPEQLYDIDYEQIHSRDHRTSEIITDSLEPVNIRFVLLIRLRISVTKFLSLNLTCASNEFGLESSVHIFLQGKGILEKAGTTIQIFVDSSTISKNFMPIVLPCRPATPDIQLKLDYEVLKEVSEKNKNSENATHQKSWTPLNLTNNHISFDPKQGFIIKEGFENISVFGLYRCSVIEADSDAENYVFVNVTKTSDPSYSTDIRSAFPMHESMSLDFSNDLIETPNVKLKNYYSEGGDPMQEIICCSGTKGSPPKLYMRPCQNTLECQLAKKSIYEEIYAGDFVNSPLQLVEINGSSECYRETFYDTCHIFVCQFGKVNYKNYFVNFFHPYAHISVSNRSQKIFETGLQDENNLTKAKLNFSQANVIALSQYEDSASAQTAPETQHILLLVGFGSQNWQELDEDLGPHSGFSFSEIFDEYDEIGYFRGYGFDDNEPVWSQPQVFLLEYNRNVYYEGEPLVFMCFGVRFFFARGSHLLITWKNGTKISVKTKNRYSAMSLLFLSGKSELFEGDSQRNTVHKFGNEVLANQEMESVECWLPLSNSEKWEKVSKPLKVLPSVAPRILEKEDEIVYFYVGDIDRNVTCTVNQGLPLATVEMTRDGLEQDIITMKNKENADLKQDSKSEGLKAEHSGVKILSTLGPEGVNLLKIMFHSVTSEDQGEYRCVVKNVNKTITRTIKVVVTEKVSFWTHISLSVTGIFILLFLGMVIWSRRKKIRQFLTEK